MNDNERIFVENKFLMNSIDKLIGKFLEQLPPPSVRRNQTDYTPLLQALRHKQPYVIKASNYLHETNSFANSYSVRVNFERLAHKSTSGLQNRKSLTPDEQLCVAAWFNIVNGLHSISNQISSEAPHAAKAKERAYMGTVIPVFAQFIKNL